MATRLYVKDVLAQLQNHLQKHDDKLDPKGQNHHVILFGEKGDNGLCATAKDHERRIMDIEKVKNEVAQVKWAVVIAILVQVSLTVLRIN